MISEHKHAKLTLSLPRAETKPVLPKEEPTGYAAKKEEVVPTGEEGREQPTPAAEYHPEVRQRVFELGNEDLKALARAHGLNPDAPEYAFGKGVKRTEARQPLAEDNNREEQISGRHCHANVR